jgi:hypothetical protein
MMSYGSTWSQTRRTHELLEDLFSGIARIAFRCQAMWRWWPLWYSGALRPASRTVLATACSKERTKPHSRVGSVQTCAQQTDPVYTSLTYDAFHLSHLAHTKSSTGH